MAENTKLATNQEQQNITAQKIRDQSAIIRNNTATAAQQEAARVERDKLRAESAALVAQEAVITKQDPTTSLYEGQDRNSGEYRYYNQATGKSYLSSTPPGAAQQQDVRDPATGYINQQTESLPNPPAVATAQTPVDIAPNTEIATPNITQTNASVLQAIQPTAGTLEQNNLASSELNQESSTVIDDPNADRPLGLAGLPINQPEVPNSGLVSPVVTETQINASNTSQDPNPETTVGALGETQSQAEARQQAQVVAKKDWRLRLSLAPGATYLYNSVEYGDLNSNILFPLKATDGVIFPYTPTIQQSYNASYEPTDLTHTNYRMYQYRNSHVGEITITADFTAQDTSEANYMLAVIHFFKTVTKMFYGLDKNPPAGLPPPLCFLTGYGQYQFDQHPVVIQSFNYSLPNDVDYIRAGVYGQMGGQSLADAPPVEEKKDSIFKTIANSVLRLRNAGLNPGATYGFPEFTSANVSNPTYVPTKMQISLVCLPVISRYAAATQFSLAKYSTGQLTRGSINPNIGGMW